MIKKLINTYKKIDKFYLILIIYSIVVFSSLVKINIFRYNNFDMGKFDLGNMSQMAWYTLHGKFMYLTDYFGSNVPRWSMSHIDPILAIFVPIFYFIPHPLTLVFAQDLLVILAVYFIFEISLIKTGNKFFSLFISLAYLSYPALGFILSWTGYHGVTPAIFFFLWFWYLIEIYQKEDNTLRFKNYVYLISLLILTLSGKEQISLYFVVLGLFLALTPKFKKFGLAVSLFSLAWFAVCFFVVIPQYASYRISSFENFTKELGLSMADAPNIYSSNYFLSRYSEFGDSYVEIAKNMILNPVKTASIFITGDKLNNLNLTFGPLLYLPFLYPLVLLVSSPDFLINYATTQGGIGTSEIYNHRISMIIPVLFLSVIYGVSFLDKFLKNFIYEKYLKIGFSVLGLVLFVNTMYFSLFIGEKNPIFSWIQEAVSKRVFAKSDLSVSNQNLKVGDITRINPLDQNDRECIKRIVASIPPLVSVSGPDLMGSHLSQRETYSIFPAGKSTSDYVIIDIYSKKLLRILELDYSLNQDFISDILSDPNYSLNFVCGNYMVLKRNTTPVNISHDELLPIQNYTNFNEKVNFEIYNKLTVVDFDFSKEVNINSSMDLRYVYKRKSGKDLNDFVLFTTLVNRNNGEIFQTVNYPTFVFSSVGDFGDKYYEEKFKIIIPPYLEKGKYMVFIGMYNQINTRSVYLGDTEIK